ncbi:hypothetical protein QP150_06555 [Sphingomonas sp. 22L2VL55-3]
MSSATMLSMAAVSLRFWLIAVVSEARKPVTMMSSVWIASAGVAGSGASPQLSSSAGMPAEPWRWSQPRQRAARASMCRYECRP